MELQGNALSWEYFDLACAEIAKQVKVSKKPVINIYGIPRGGLVVAVKLSHLLNIPIITDITEITAKTLIVDDIADTGKTLQALSLSCPKFFFILIATIYYHKQSLIKPNIWIFEKKANWIVFPWE